MIYFSHDIKESFRQILENLDYTSLFVLTDENTERFCLPHLQLSVPFDLISVPAGEKSKSFATAEGILLHLMECNADRKSVLVCLGGGVVTDLGGFIASVFKRGIRYINIPTSFLALTDAAVGAKTGINLDHFKNQVGTFYPPDSILIFTRFLETLPEREILSGFAEMIKHALISGEELWKKISAPGFDPVKNAAELIPESLNIKVAIVNEDPFEKDKRQLLNFGHTIGHALESLSLEKDNDPLTHGDAVALGMIAEAFISRELNYLSDQSYQMIKEMISGFYKGYSVEAADIPMFLQFLQADKKNEMEKVKMVVLHKPGKAEAGITVQKKLIIGSLKEFDY
jgi:3-dehydroquinate synthase